MARDAEGKVGKFTAQNMSNTLLAYAKLEHHPGHLMEVMAAEALRKLETFTPQVQTLESHVRGTFCASSAMPGHQHIYTDRLAPAIALANRMSIQASLLQMSSDVVVEKYFFLKQYSVYNVGPLTCLVRLRSAQMMCMLTGSEQHCVGLQQAGSGA